MPPNRATSRIACTFALGKAAMMTLSRVSSAIMTVTALAFAVGIVLAPARAQNQTMTGDAPALCRIVWDGQTSGGDTQTVHGEMQINRSLAQEDGSLMMFGSGEATVTYHTGAAGFRVTSGSPFIAKLNVIVTSKDGRSAEISIDTATDEPEHTIVEEPGSATFTTEMETPPTITATLQDGVSVPYSESLGTGRHQHGKSGTLTLHYCPSPAH